MLKNVTDTVFYVGVDDKDIDLFENQYIVPNGIAYNSYVIMDEKIAIMDMVDAKCADQWFANVAEVLGDRKPDYLVISHLEPDHSANLGDVLAKYPDIKIVSNAKLFGMLPNFFEVPVADRSVTVAEGQTLSLGSHTLQFFMAPMVHWPEVMVTYEQSEKILFSADAFGKFGTLDTDEDWACEARRYYFNIGGKYGMPAQALLKKAAGLDAASGEPNKKKVATLTRAQAEEIAKTKMPDLNAANLESATEMIKGTARSMGIVIEN